MKKLLIISTAILAFSSLNAMASEHLMPQNHNNKTHSTMEKSTMEKKMDDADIHKSINSSFTKDSELSHIKIDTEVKHGDVVLKGYVPNLEAKNRAEHLSKSVEGVKSVKNELMVKK